MSDLEDNDVETIEIDLKPKKGGAKKAVDRESTAYQQKLKNLEKARQVKARIQANSTKKKKTKKTKQVSESESEDESESSEEEVVVKKVVRRKKKEQNQEDMLKSIESLLDKRLAPKKEKEGKEEKEAKYDSLERKAEQSIKNILKLF